MLPAGLAEGGVLASPGRVLIPAATALLLHRRINPH